MSAVSTREPSAEVSHHATAPGWSQFLCPTLSVSRSASLSPRILTSRPSPQSLTIRAPCSPEGGGFTCPCHGQCEGAPSLGASQACALPGGRLSGFRCRGAHCEQNKPTRQASTACSGASPLRSPFSNPGLCAPTPRALAPCSSAGEQEEGSGVVRLTGRLSGNSSDKIRMKGPPNLLLVS